VESVEFSPDGEFLVSGSKFGNRLMYWKVADGNLLWEKELGAEIEAVTFSPDGRYIASGDENYRLSIFDRNGNLLHILENDGAFDGIAWSKEGTYLAGGTENGKVVIWNTRTWKKEKELDSGGGTINSLEFTSDGRILLAAGNRPHPPPYEQRPKYGIVRAWEVGMNWSMILDLNAQDFSTKSIRLHPDEKSFAIANVAGECKIYSFPEGKELWAHSFGKRIEAVAYHPEGNFLFTADHTHFMNVVDTRSMDVVDRFPCRHVEYIDFSPDGRLMATGHEDSGIITLYLLWTTLESNEDYHKLSNEILKNRDLQK
jgi:WD40 repeat protein